MPMQRTSCEMLGWMNHKLESRLPREILINLDMQMITSNGREQRETKEPLNEDERREWKSLLKTQYSKNDDHGIQSHHFVANRWEKMETVADFTFSGSKITMDGDCSHEIKGHFLLGRKAMTNLDSILKSRDITLPTKVCIVKAMVFPVVIYRCESWTVKKAECQNIDAFELWCWRRLLRVPWTARRSNQTILREVSSVQFSFSVVSNSLWPHRLQHARPPCPSPTLRVYSNSCPLPDYLLEGLMLRLQIFGHLMWKAN